MTQPKRRLRNLKVNEVSLVDRGDNPPAEVLLFKRHEPGLVDKILSVFSSGEDDAEIEKRLREELLAVPDFLKQPPEAAQQGGSMDLSKLSKDDRETVEAAIASAGELDGLKEQLAASQARIAELEAAKPTDPPKPEDAVTKALAKLPDEVRKQLEASLAKRDEESQAMQKQLAELTEERAFHKYAAEVGDLDGLAEPREKLIAKLWSIQDPTHRAEMQKTLEASAAAVRRGNLFNPLGTAAEGGSGVMAKVAAKAAELRKVDPKLTPEQAEAQVFRTEPALYSEYLAENGAN